MGRQYALALILVGVVIAIVGFLTLDYWAHGGLVGTAMTGAVFGLVPYRYVLICSVLLVAFGLYWYWASGTGEHD